MGSTESTLLPMEDDHNSSQATRSRREPDASGGEMSGDDPWWWEIENQDLVLDHEPNVTTESTLGAESEGGAVALSDDFNTLLKIGQHVSITISNNNNNNNNNVNNNDNNNSAIVSENITLEEKPVTDLTTEYSTEVNDTVNRERHDFGSSSDAVSVGVAAVGDSQSLDEFKEELREKRLARQTALQDLREEIAALRKQLTAEQMLTRRLRQSENAAAATKAGASGLESALENQQHSGNNGINKMNDMTMVDKTDVTDAMVVIDAETQLVDEDDDNACSRSRHANIELANAQLALQLATSENLSLRTELGVTQKQVGTLKEVVACCKQMLAMKEEQCSQLKTKLSEIEQSFGEREMKIMSDNLRQEYERQLGNIRQLRQLYEERQRIATAEQENLQRLVAIKKDELGAEQDRTKNFEERNQALMKEVETANKELAALREECNEHKFGKKALKEEMEAVNTLFSQMVMGFNGKNNLDIDRLATMLEENRTLLNDMATKEASCSDGATLPKLLFELVEQAAVGSRVSSRSVTPESAVGRMAEKRAGEGEENNDEHEDGAVVDAVLEIDAEDAAIKNEESTETAANIKVEQLNDGLQAVQNVEEEQAEEDDEEEVAVNEADAISSSGNDNNNHDNNSNCSSSINHSSQKPHHHHQQHYRKNATNKKKASSPSAASTSTPINSSTILKFHEPNIFGQVASTQEIIGNLPKVWKVLMELLSHHKIEQVQFEENGAGEDCYKSVETPNGPKAELSVSKTYIKLKDLILEKKSLVKETNRLKTLNCHLDYRLNEQEKRLSAVSLELTKTWHLVGKMQRQHRQLHTQEQILRYQLQQKRRLLSELKDELEYCRRKWAAARAKNDESQEQCNDLRREFAKRKLEDANNSAESGYSDSGPASDEEVGRSAVPAEEVACSRSELRQMFEHSRKIKRMQSTSPGRAAYDLQMAEVVLRWNSAPPTCGWRADTEEDEDGINKDSDDDNCDEDERGEIATDGGGGSQGAIPKEGIRSSRSKQRVRTEVDEETSAAVQEAAGTSTGSSVSAAPSGDHVVRIQRLEEQCKSLIQQVLETSDSRERLEVQLCRFQDAIAPVQYAMPLDELISKKRLERMTRASSAPASPAGTLTPREEEYTRKRSERLGRLEEESRQLISRIKRTSDRGQYLRCSLERLHRTCNRGGDSSSAAISRESSFDSNTEEEAAPSHQAEGQNVQKKISSTESPLTETEEAYTTRRADRLKRIEAESKQLLTQLGQNKERGTMLGNQLDVLHQQHGGEDAEDFATTNTTASATSPTVEKRIENIERMSSNRAERLRILEEEGKLLISRLSSTSERGTLMINRIAEREQSRAARQHETAAKEASASREAEKPFKNNGSTSADEEDDEEEASAVAVAVVAADPLLPTLKNVACSSIVSEELAECVTVTTTTSQIAHNIEIQGAVPKSKPLAQLSVVANFTRSKSRPATSSPSSGDTESLEEMVKRLQSIPFPGTESVHMQERILKEQEEEQVEEHADQEREEHPPEVHRRREKSEEQLEEQTEEHIEEQPEEHIEKQPEEQPEEQTEEHIAEQIEDQRERQIEEQSREQSAEAGALPEEELKESHET